MNLPKWVEIETCKGKTVESLLWGYGTGLIVWTDGTYSYTEQNYENLSERPLDYSDVNDRDIMLQGGLITEEEHRNHVENKKKLAAQKKREKDLAELARLKALYEGSPADEG